MGRKNFKLMVKRKNFLVSMVVILGVSVFGAVILARNLNQVGAAGSDWKNMTPSQMTDLTLSHVYTGSEVDSTINSTQSFTITDKYFVAVQAHSGNENSGWIVATDFDDLSEVAWAEWHNIGHGNGATWNSKKNQIVIADGYKRFFFDANNGNFIEDKNVSTPASGIAYDPTDDWYIQTSGDNATILDNNFGNLNPARTFDAGHRLVNQDVAYYSGHIYRIAWGGCSYLRSDQRIADAEFCEEYFGEDSNAIYQFDMNGNFERAFYIEEGFGELEGADFKDGTMYLLFNGKGDCGRGDQSYCYSVYKATGLNFLTNQTVTFANSSVNKVYGDGKFTNAATTDGGGAITYSSNNTSVATVNANTGEITIQGAGTATITATAVATSDYGGGTATYSLTVAKATSPKPSEINNTLSGLAGDKLSTITFTTPGLVWVDENATILSGEHEYQVRYTKDNDADNYTTETFTVVVVGQSVDPDPEPEPDPDPDPDPIVPDDPDSKPDTEPDSNSNSNSSSDSNNSNSSKDKDSSGSKVIGVPNTGENVDGGGNGGAIVFGILPIGVIIVAMLSRGCFGRNGHRKFD